MRVMLPGQGCTGLTSCMEELEICQLLARLSVVNDWTLDHLVQLLAAKGMASTTRLCCCKTVLAQTSGSYQAACIHAIQAAFSSEIRPEGAVSPSGRGRQTSS